MAIFGQGFFVTEYYSPEKYNFHEQIWDAVQDSNGYLHFGEGNGMLTFDGVKWQENHIGETGRGISLFISKAGKLYASGQHDFGFFDQDFLSRLKYSSISEKYYQPNDIVNPHFSSFEIGDTVFFYGEQGLEVIIDDDSLLKFPFKNQGVNKAVSFKRQVLLGTNTGLYQFNKGDFIKIKNSDQFTSDTLLVAKKISDDILLLGYLRNGLFFFDGSNFTKVNDLLNPYFVSHVLIDAQIINDNFFAVSTVYGGIFILNRSGELVKAYTNYSASLEKPVLDLFIDKEQNLWIGLSGGLQKTNLSIPIHVYNSNLGIGNGINWIIICNDQIFLSQKGGDISMSTWRNFENTMEFNSTGLPGKLVQFKDDVYAYNSTGLFIYSEHEGFKKIKNGNFDFHLVNYDEDRKLYLMQSDGLAEFNGNTLRVKKIKLSPGITFGLKKNGRVILKGKLEMAYLSESDEMIQIPLIKNADAQTIINTVGVIDGKVYIGTEGASGTGGLYVLNEEKLVFEKAKKFGNLDEKLTSIQVLQFQQCENGDVWIHNDKKIKRLVNENGNYFVTESPYQLIGEGDAINTIVCDGDEVWFGGTKGLYHLTDPDWDYKTDFKTNITGIFVNNDSLIYGGYGEPVKELVLPYKDNELRFTYAAASYIDPERNTYSVKLEGFDKDWSDWSLETQKDYTNIPEGDYIFKVRSRNVFEVDGKADAIPFSVLPPWYRTWWAYLLYVAFVVQILYTAYKVRVNQLLKVERMRTKIASDLHDEVSATLTGISYFATAVKMDKDESRKDHFIDLISESAGDAKEKITDIVWSINPDNDDWTMFFSKCRRYASDLLESKDMKYELKIPEQIPGKLKMEVRQHLWMIFKEMLTNAVRHANAARVDILMDVDGEYLRLVVQDDGKGFDSENGKAGNGVSNIKKRAAQIRASIELDSEHGMGTRWILKVPV